MRRGAYKTAQVIKSLKVEEDYEIPKYVKCPVCESKQVRVLYQIQGEITLLCQDCLIKFILKGNGDEKPRKA